MLREISHAHSYHFVIAVWRAKTAMLSVAAVDRLFNRLTSSREIRLDIRTCVDNDDDAACV